MSSQPVVFPWDKQPIKTDVSIANEERLSGYVPNLIDEYEHSELPAHAHPPRKPVVLESHDIDDICQALACIDPNILHDDQVRVGMALKAHLGEDGFNIFDSWASNRDGYSYRKMFSRWKSFNPTSVNIGTLYHYAQESGYQPPTRAPTQRYIPDFVLNGQLTGWHPEPTEPVSAPIVVENAFPSHLFTDLTGLPKTIYDYIIKTSPLPQPILALGASLAAAGAIQGHRIRDQNDFRTNLYCVGVAPSGAGKDHARRIINRIFRDSGISRHAFGKAKSGAGIKAILRKECKGHGLLLWDEFGRALKNITNWKAGNHERDIIDTLIEIFTTSSSYMLGEAYANRDSKTPPEGIEQPCLCLYGTTVPDNFYAALTGSDAIDGFLARLLVFESKQYVELTREMFSESQVLDTPEYIISEVQRWYSMPTNTAPTGNTDQRIVPKTVYYSPEACEIFFKVAQNSQKRGKDGSPSIWARTAELACKIALCVSNAEIISKENAEYGSSLAQYCCEQMVSSIHEHVASSHLEAQKKTFVKFAKEQRKWLTKSDFTNRFKDIPRRVREEILADLVEGGEMASEVIRSGPDGGRPSNRYRFFGAE